MARTRGPAAHGDEKKALDRKTVSAIRDAAQKVQRRVDDGRKPEMSFPVRSLQNVHFDRRQGYFELGR